MELDTCTQRRRRMERRSVVSVHGAGNERRVSGCNLRHEMTPGRPWESWEPSPPDDQGPSQISHLGTCCLLHHLVG